MDLGRGRGRKLRVIDKPKRQHRAAVSVDERVVLVGARWRLIRIRRVGWSVPSILTQLHLVVLTRRR